MVATRKKDGPMKPNDHPAILFLAFLLVAGCSTAIVESKLYPGVPVYEPTNSDRVEILRSEPDRPYQKLGEIYLQPKGNPSQKEILKKLRKAAAKMGADAVILVADKGALTGGPVAGPRWWNRELSPGFDKIIVGVAIWYSEGMGEILKSPSPSK
jgi:hypothetical protein